MKKIYFFLFAVGVVFNGFSQVSSLAFSESAGTYTPLSGATILATQTAPTGTSAQILDDEVYTTTLPFAFTYAGTVYASGATLNVTSNGFVSFGSAPSGTDYTSISGSDNNTIAAFSRDLQGGWAATGNTTNGSATITGFTNTAGFVAGKLVSGSGIPAGATVVSVVPNSSITISAACTSTGTGTTINCAGGEISSAQVGSTFVIQFANMRPYGASLVTLNFQIILKQGTNAIDVVYGNCVGAGGGSYFPQVGLRGTSSADFNDLTGTNWTAPTVGLSNAATMTFGNAGGTTVPASGVTYHWAVPSCLAPSSVAVGSITTSTASVSFSGAGSAFIVEYGPVGFTPGTGATANGGSVKTGTSSPIALTGLVGATAYDVYVRQDCTGSAAGYSVNSLKATFTTACSPTNLPHSEGFNSTSLPLCWQTQIVAVQTGTKISFGSSGSFPTTAPYEGADFLQYSSFFSTNGGSGSEERLVSLPLNTTGVPSVDVNFYWRNENNPSYTTATEGVQVQYSLDNGSTWTDVGPVIARHDPSLASGTAQWNLKTVTLPGAAGNVASLLVGFKFHSDFGDNQFMDFPTFQATPSCLAPTAVTAGSITTTGASIGFSGAGSSFVVEYGPANFTPGTGATANGGTTVTGTSSPIAITGLSTATTYDVYVRQNCTAAGNGYSANSLKITFTTACAAVNVPYTQNFESATAPAIPSCTSTQPIGASTDWYTDNAPGFGFTSNTLEYSYNQDFVTAANTWFYTQGINLTAGTAYQISYNYGNNSTFYTEKLEVAYGTSPSAASMTNVLADYNSINQAAIQSDLVTFTPSTSGVYYFGFNAHSDANQWLLFVDNINIDVVPVCPPPTGVAVSSITASSASVSFTGAGSAYIVEYGLSGFTPGSGLTPGTNGTIVTSSSSPVPLTGLTSSSSYDVYVRQDCTGGGNGYGPNSLAVTFNTTLGNDDATGAIALTVGAGCAGPIYNNTGATAGASEPYPSCSGTISAPVWFSFIAPASGAVRVSTDYPGGTFIDSKVGVFSATDPGDYSTFNIISCDDDGGSSTANGWLSVVYATGLTPGDTYYVAVDLYDVFTSTGSYCVSVDELNASMLATTNTCSSLYQSPAGSNPAYAGWIPLLDGTSHLLALVRQPTGTSPTSFTAAQNIHSGSVRQTGGVYYLDRNFHIVSSETNVDVQFFFLNSELAALTAHDATATLGNLGVIKQTDGGTCQNDFNTTNGAFTQIFQNGNGTAQGVSWISINTPSFSNFFIANGAAVVPVTLAYFEGANKGATNYLDWRVTCTSAPSVTLVLERSGDGAAFYPINTINASAIQCLQEFNYTDAKPLPAANYYRLKLVTPDGKISYSNIVLLMEKSKAFEIVSLVPNPASTTMTVSLYASKPGKLLLTVSDPTGRMVMQQSVIAASGANAIPVNVAKLSAGSYSITVVNTDGTTNTARFVKY